MDIDQSEKRENTGRSTDVTRCKYIIRTNRKPTTTCIVHERQGGNKIYEVQGIKAVDVDR